MSRPLSVALMLVALVFGALFVWLTGLSMPARVASHFDGSGVANASMPRDRYVDLMIACVVGVPALLIAIAQVVGRGGARINLPNAAYWLMPQRRVSTIDVIRSRMEGFAIILCAFLCYVHWLVVRANATHPVALSGPAFYGGLAVFLLFVAVWTIALVRRFNLPR